jgi:hypothetical protein
VCVPETRFRFSQLGLIDERAVCEPEANCYVGEWVLRDMRRGLCCEVETHVQKPATCGDRLRGELVLVKKTAEPVATADAMERQ